MEDEIIEIPDFELVEISEDPLLPNLVRKVELVRFQWNMRKSVKELNLYTTAHYFNSNGEEVITERIKPYDVVLRGDNTTNVLPLLTQEEIDNGAIQKFLGEYDDFMIKYFANPIILPQLMVGMIQYKDQVDKRFNI